MAAPSFEAHHLISGLAKPVLAAFCGRHASPNMLYSFPSNTIKAVNRVPRGWSTIRYAGWAHHRGNTSSS